MLYKLLPQYAFTEYQFTYFTMMRTGRMLLSRGFSTSKDDGGRLRLAVKVVGGVLFMSFNVGMIWYWLSQEEEGRKRAE
jgi:hypothetical protein